MLLVSRPSLRKRLDSPPFVKNVEDYFTVTFPMEDSCRETITYGINFGDRPTFYFIGRPPFAPVHGHLEPRVITIAGAMLNHVNADSGICRRSQTFR
jgi:hypothetical protein